MVLVVSEAPPCLCAIPTSALCVLLARLPLPMSSATLAYRELSYLLFRWMSKEETEIKQAVFPVYSLHDRNPTRPFLSNSTGGKRLTLWDLKMWHVPGKGWAICRGKATLHFGLHTPEGQSSLLGVSTICLGDTWLLRDVPSETLQSVTQDSGEELRAARDSQAQRTWAGFGSGRVPWFIFFVSCFQHLPVPHFPVL